jgi:hypothetical protein
MPYTLGRITGWAKGMSTEERLFKSPRVRLQM